VSVRRIAVIAPFVALVVLAAALRTAPEAARFLLVGAFAYLAVAALSLVHRSWPQDPAVLRSARRPAPRVTSLRAIDELESAVRLASSAGLQYQHNLRPVLAAIARERLEARGISWQDEPEKAEEALGTLAWRLVRPHHGPPDRDAPGATLEELEKTVRRLEEV
jgi:hypothetical protein